MRSSLLHFIHITHPSVSLPSLTITGHTLGGGVFNYTQAEWFAFLHTKCKSKNREIHTCVHTDKQIVLNLELELWCHNLGVEENIEVREVSTGKMYLWHQKTCLYILQTVSSLIYLAISLGTRLVQRVFCSCFTEVCSSGWTADWTGCV